MRISRARALRSRLQFLALALTMLPPGMPARTAHAEEPTIENLPTDPLAWPEINRTNRPWTRWWWLGSAVDRENVTRRLEQYRAAGFGGVEICPIYGAKGAEARYIDFLSPRWMEMLAHTTSEARRLDLGVDMTTGTGWPFGGPEVAPALASSRAVLKAYDVPGGGTLAERLPAGTLQCLRAVKAEGEGEGKPLELTDRVHDGRLDWVAPPGKWRLYAVVQSGPVQKVKRAAPGGEGNVLDPYSVSALDAYLSRFDHALAGYHGALPRAHFHDSFEYYGATWTTDFFKEFQDRRGYDLRDHLPGFFGEGTPDAVARIKRDYRTTLAELHGDYIARWTDWAHAHQGLTRNQAHGAPASLLDLYSAVDIPEIEIFRRPEVDQVAFLKFASSAAHTRGRTLASAESFTWLGEHFQVPLSQLKPAADLLFLAGVNHLVYHGIPYSPADAAWPGWQFYAAVNFGPDGGLWRDLPAFNAYVARCQSILQAGRPANDVLLYFPIEDLLQVPEGQLLTFPVPGKWMIPLPFHSAAQTLWDRGYGFDAVSDRLLAGAEAAEGTIQLGGNRYRTIVVPGVRVMPPDSLEKLLALARAGANVVFLGGFPDDVPGWNHFESRRAALRASVRGLGPGAVPAGEDLEALLHRAGVVREALVDTGLRFIRRTHGQGHHYFLAHLGDRPLDGWVTLGTPAASAAILDPRFENAAGTAPLRHTNDGSVQVYLQMLPGESRVLRTFTSEAIAVAARPWPLLEPAGEPQAIQGRWKVEFLEGGPELPPGFEANDLASWTTLGGPEAARFAGTARYTIAFDQSGNRGESDDFLLDLGRVAESARVRLNGRDLGTLWCPPFQIAAGPALKPGRNVLEVEVTNLAANRIADLDRRGVNWKYFREINFVNIDYKPFDASQWPPRDSGLLGPVRLIPLKAKASSP
jgi:hypothetical protein